MVGLGSVSTPMCITSPLPCKPRSNFPGKLSHPLLAIHKFHSLPLSSHFSPQKNKVIETHFTLKASSSVGTADYTEEPTTKVKFQTSLSLPGCSSSLSLLGTGYREKVFAIIGVKVYAAGLYVDQSILSKLDAWKGRSATQLQDDMFLFKSIFEAPMEKSLQIVLVRDVDGKTFWDALDEAVSPRIKAPTPVDESALSTLRSIFQGRPLNKGTSIFLTWPDTSKMLIAVSLDGIPTCMDATIESAKVGSALFDVFFGDSSVSPSLKTSVAGGLAAFLK
ncbi:fatty-acid-binding protein 3, chloroplastic isoform X2 [Hibiscus syriacus]|uniref:fatty-acid-binding protein 3, chloroplastic isoform X2 n=1 Tax=Hibiscus syriacus TaxID=106335 RepID=UPI001923198B|nr:fatty-acid-binding protein 3, chloroplastic isoform X2 [Hibiscus syriacus]